MRLRRGVMVAGSGPECVIVPSGSGRPGDLRWSHGGERPLLVRTNIRLMHIPYLSISLSFSLPVFVYYLLSMWIAVYLHLLLFLVESVLKIEACATVPIILLY